MTTDELLEPIEKRLADMVPNPAYPLEKVYSYSPCGHHEDDISVSWNGKYRFVERVSRKFADEIVKRLTFSISAPADIYKLIARVEKLDAALKVADEVLKEAAVIKIYCTDAHMGPKAQKARADIAAILGDQK